MPFFSLTVQTSFLALSGIKDGYMNIEKSYPQTVIKFIKFIKFSRAISLAFPFQIAFPVAVDNAT